ncbi:single hybrid motif-containing protein [Panus rudis PR-1116 ss-1]|nr:single hybrid motif-containing protein [Panus rudis PR-1116 ss-1]
MSASRCLQSLVRSSASRRWLQTSAVRHAVSKFEMPAMSPTMTEGAIANWKKKEGESFSAGDVLLEIETDKATIDVEAQDDGVVGKILVPDGTRNVPVGKTIALLAEEGDDLSNLEIPEESQPAPSKPQEAASSSSQQSTPSAVPDKAEASANTPSRPHTTPSSSRPLFPSVLRLLSENGIQNADEIKGTGVRGMLTKGDVLTHLGKASGPLGTYKAALEKEEQKSEKVQKKETAPPPLDGFAVRRLIVSNMLDASIKARAPPAPTTPPDFDSIIADYLPPSPKATPSSAAASAPKAKSNSSSYLDGLI